MLINDVLPVCPIALISWMLHHSWWRKGGRVREEEKSITKKRFVLSFFFFFSTENHFSCVNRLLIAFKFVIRSIENFSIAIGLYACGIAFSFHSPYYVYLILHDDRIVTSSCAYCWRPQHCGDGSSYWIEFLENCVSVEKSLATRLRDCSHFNAPWLTYFQFCFFF